MAGFDGYLKRVNVAHARSLGYTREELLARPFMDNIYPDDVESVEAVLAKLAAGEDIVEFECREVCADGSVRCPPCSASFRCGDCCRIQQGAGRCDASRRGVSG